MCGLSQHNLSLISHDLAFPCPWQNKGSVQKVTCPFHRRLFEVSVPVCSTEIKSAPGPKQSDWRSGLPTSKRAKKDKNRPLKGEQHPEPIQGNLAQSGQILTLTKKRADFLSTCRAMLGASEGGVRVDAGPGCLYLMISFSFSSSCRWRSMTFSMILRSSSVRCDKSGKSRPTGARGSAILSGIGRGGHSEGPPRAYASACILAGLLFLVLTRELVHSCRTHSITARSLAANQPPNQ